MKEKRPSSYEIYAEIFRGIGYDVCNFQVIQKICNTENDKLS